MAKKHQGKRNKRIEKRTAKNRADNFSEKTNREPVKAKFSAANGGFGFALPLSGGKDIFIPPKYTGTAIDGDIVAVRLIDESRKRFDSRGLTGRVIEILERPRKIVVAELNGTRSARPLDRKLPEEIRINKLPKDAQVGDWVKLRLLDTGKKHTEQLRAEAFSTIGEAGTVAADLAAIAAEFHLEDAYTEAQCAAAEKLGPEKIGRIDCTKPFTVTIDPADAHDFDDAISIAKERKTGNVLLGVHIADVAAYVRPGSTFDKEAAKRGFSSYIPGMFRPMLPQTLTQKISLREGVDAPAHSILFTINGADGKILDFKRFHSTVRIDKKLDYSTVQAYLNDHENAPKDWTLTLKRNLNLLADTVRKMRELRRKQEQFLDMPLPEIRVLCDEKTLKITGIERKEPCEADFLVEECMLAANTAVATELIERQIPGLFRIHPEPGPDKIDEFAGQCDALFHISVGDILASRTACQNFLSSIPQDHRRAVILSMFLRSLPRASYDAAPGLHYGLGKEKYTHFTSPIRRYTDLLVHQQLWNADTNSRLKSKKKLENLALTCSALEENNDNAFFAATDRLKVHFLKQNGALENSTMYEAVITRITASGLICSIDSMGIYGFIPREKLRGGDFRKHSGKHLRMSASYGHTSYQPGDFIYVTLDSIDPVRGQAVFRPAM